MVDFNFHQDQIENYAKEKMKVVETFLSLCVSDIGLKEEAGNRGKWVDGINKWIKAALGSAYCVSWAQFKLNQASELTGWKFNVGSDASCKAFADECPEDMKIDKSEIQPGDIIIWKLIGGWTGHAAVVEKVLEAGKIQTIEANTSPSNDYIERDGGGCFRKVRPIDGIGSLKLYAIIRPTIRMYRT